jgi:hypothetical protein
MWCVSQTSLLQELLSHNVDEDAAKGKQKLSRDLAYPIRLRVNREREYSRLVVAAQKGGHRRVSLLAGTSKVGSGLISVDLDTQFPPQTNSKTV